MRRQPSSRTQELITGALVIGALLLVGWCSHTLGTSRATVGDIRAVETQVAERCR